MTLSKQDTNILKGIALLLLLAHHLFYKNPGLYDDVHLKGDYYLVQTVGYAAKICVAIFVFLSGYGLSMKYKEVIRFDKKRFYIERFTKLMLNYWLIWLIFVPISVLFLGPSLQETYGSFLPLKLFLDLIGLINVVGWYGYNQTWWFYSCIILLYAMFPIIHIYANKYMPILLITSVAFCLLPGNVALCARLYLPSFLFGVYVARNNIDVPSRVTVFSLLVILMCERVMLKNVKYEILLDSIVVVMGGAFYVKIRLSRWISLFLQFLGRHSMNIFLFHTFIFYLWFREYIYMSRNPLIIYIFLLLSCIFVSIMIEQLKRLIKFEKCQVRIIEKLCLITSA